MAVYTEPKRIVRERDKIEDALVDYDPSLIDPEEKLKRRTVRSIVDLLRYKDTQDMLRAESLELINNGDPVNVIANTATVERKIELHAHMGDMAFTAIQGTVLFAGHLNSTLGKDSKLVTRSVIYDAFDEVQTAFGESPKAAQVQQFAPEFGLVPIDGQNYFNVRELNV